MSDSDWLMPSIALTVLSGAVALLLIPSYAGILPAITLLPLWLIVALLLTAIYSAGAMAVAGIASPIAHCRQFAMHEWRTAAIFAFGIFIAGLNMTTFMWTKPLLNQLVDFNADMLLANLDRALFFGHDPWSLFRWLNTRPMAVFYHRGWFALMILTLVIVLAAPASPKKSAAMITYFLLWSVVGPLTHLLVPAAGPIFFEQLGYGDRFTGIRAVPETAEVATYLWTVYQGPGFGPGSGISAMPSMHIATVCWMVFATYLFAPRLFAPMAAAGALTFLLSVALGWHYAVDGIAAAGLTMLTWAAANFYVSWVGMRRISFAQPGSQGVPA